MISISYCPFFVSLEDLNIETLWHFRRLVHHSSNNVLKNIDRTEMARVKSLMQLHAFVF